MSDRTSPSRWFPGYSVAAVAVVTHVASAPGQTFVVSQLNGPLREAFGIGELSLNTAYAVATVLAAFPLVFVGEWTDRIGPRAAIMWIAAAFGVACLVLASAQGFWTVALAFFLVRFLGQGSLKMVGEHATAMWFHRRLGTITGLKQVLAFGIWALFPQATLLLIGEIGWRWTWVVFGGLVWLSVIPLAALFVRDRPEDLGLRMDGDPVSSAAPGADAAAREAPLAGLDLRAAMRTPAYWILASVVFISPLIGTALLFDIQPILGVRGLDAATAAWAVSAWSLGMAAFAIPAGALTDRMQPRFLIGLGVLAIAAASVGVWWAPTGIAAAGAMLLFAAGQATAATASTATIARYFGRAHHGAIRSSLIRLGVVGTGLGPIFTGVSASWTGGYGAATIAFVAMVVPVTVAAFLLRAPRIL